MNGRLWKNAEVVKQLGLSAAQVQHMEQIFQDYRLKLAELHAALRIEEDKMGPMLRAESPNENEVLEQIDRIALQRANLEKTNAQMAFEIRQVLTPEQWKTLQSMLIQRGHRPGERHGIGDRPVPPAPQQ
jgi:Spy/CpxP family protein refolding chaperone